MVLVCTLIILYVFLSWLEMIKGNVILEAEPIIIKGKPFIIMLWSSFVDQAKARVLSMPY